MAFPKRRAPQRPKNSFPCFPTYIAKLLRYPRENIQTEMGEGLERRIERIYAIAYTLD
jgi:hypothetical protein